MNNPTNTTCNNVVNIPSSSRHGNSSTTQACAACKYRRRKCTPDCILAPYFPQDRHQQFLNAHKLFGVSNITKIIKHLDQSQRDQAMQSIIIESDLRASDPVSGCYRIIQGLQMQIEYHRGELDLVLQQLAASRTQAHHQHAATQAQAQAHLQAQHAYLSSLSAEYAASASDSDEVLNVDPLHFYNVAVPGMPHHHYLLQQVLQDDNNNNSSVSLQEDFNSWDMQNSESLSTLSLHDKSGSVNVGDEYDHKPMIEVALDDKIGVRFEPQDLI